MIYKGTVIDIKSNHAIVMTEQAEFFKIIKKNNMLMGKQIIFLEDDFYKDSFNINRILRYAAVISILVFSMLVLSQFKTLNENYYMPMAVVSVDINPSIELEINEEYKLLNVTSKNDEGKLIIDNNLIGKDIEDALNMILLKAESENYLTSDKNSVLIGYSIISENTKIDLNSFEQILSEKLKSNSDLNYVEVILLQGDKNKLQESRQNDITIGKFLLYLDVNTEGDLEITEVKSMSTEELLSYPRQLRNRNHGKDSNASENNYDNYDSNVNEDNLSVDDYDELKDNTNMNDLSGPKDNGNMNDFSGLKDNSNINDSNIPNDSGNMYNEVEENTSNESNETKGYNNIEQDNEEVRKLKYRKGKN